MSDAIKRARDTVWLDEWTGQTRARLASVTNAARTLANALQVAEERITKLEADVRMLEEDIDELCDDV